MASLARALTVNLRRRKDGARDAPPHGNSTRPTISSPVNLVSTTNMMVKAAWSPQDEKPPAAIPAADAVHPSQSDPHTPKLGHAGTAHSRTPDSTRTPAGNANRAHFSVASDGSAASKKSGQSDTGSFVSLPSLVHDNSSPQSPNKLAYPPPPLCVPATPSSGHSYQADRSYYPSSPSEDVLQERHSGNNIRRMPSIPERAPSRLHGTISKPNPLLQSSSVRVSSGQHYSPVAPPTPRDTTMFSEELEALDTFARDLSQQTYPHVYESEQLDVEPDTDQIPPGLFKHSADDYIAVLSILKGEIMLY